MNFNYKVLLFVYFVLLSTLHSSFHRFSCDIRVLRIMRERTMGNSSTQLYKKLQEQHSEKWLQRVLQYLTACEPFTRLPLVHPPAFAKPPELPDFKPGCWPCMPGMFLPDFIW